MNRKDKIKIFTMTVDQYNRGSNEAERPNQDDDDDFKLTKTL